MISQKISIKKKFTWSCDKYFLLFIHFFLIMSSSGAGEEFRNESYKKE